MADKALQEVVEQLLAEVRSMKGQLDKKLPTVLSKKHAAQELDISLSKLKGLIRKGEIRVCEVGGTTGVPASEIRRIAESATRAGQPVRRSASSRRVRGPKPTDGMTEAEKIRAALRKPKRTPAP